LGIEMVRASTVCAVICTYNRYDLLEKAIESLAAQQISRDRFSIMVVDNSPDPLRAENESTKYRDVPGLVYRYESTAGLSNARNVAARESSADVLAYLDDDAIASPSWAASLIDAFNFGEAIGIVGGQIMPLWESDRPSWLADSLLGYVSVVDWGGETRVAGESEWFAGANISFRRTCIIEAGFFDTNLGRTGAGASLLSNEEVALVRRIHALGYRSVYCPKASVDHLVEHKRLTQHWFRSRVVWQAISDFLASDKGAMAAATPDWAWVLEYLSIQRPENRSIRGLYVDQASPRDFTQQLSALYNFTLSLLAGFRGVR